MTDILVSVEADLAQKIISGEKTVELRKKVPTQKVGRMFVYAKKPVKKLIGYVEVKRIAALEFLPRIIKMGPPGDLYIPRSSMSYANMFQYACVSEEQFKNYFQDSKTGYGIFLKNPVAIAPISLPFSAPQSFRYVDGDSLICK